MRRAAPVLASCLVCLGPATARAGKPAQPPSDPARAASETAPDEPPDADTPDEDIAAPPVAGPSPVDTLAGHVAVAAAGSLVVPFGELQRGLAQARVLAPGGGVGLDLGYGLTHTLVLGLWGQAAWFGAGSACHGCSSSTFAAGPFLRYHLVQGVRFDPWVSAGLGYRATTVSAPATSLAYGGLDLLHIQVGGDWYVARNLGVGPMLDLGAGWYASRPATAAAAGAAAGRGDAAAYYWFTVGARLTFDSPGK
jgi:hypothetical protein